MTELAYDNLNDWTRIDGDDWVVNVGSKGTAVGLVHRPDCHHLRGKPKSVHPIRTELADWAWEIRARYPDRPALLGFCEQCACERMPGR